MAFMSATMHAWIDASMSMLQRNAPKMPELTYVVISW